MKYLLSLFVLLSAVGVSSAASFNEVGDAGELLSTAQNTSGSGALTSINGYLDLGDVDLYKINITDYTNFTVSMTADLSPDLNPLGSDGFAGLWLFDMAGLLVTSDSLYDLIFVDYAFFDPLTEDGEYLLAVALFGIEPVNLGSLAGGWDKSIANIQTGPYSLSLEGAAFAVPTPPILWLLSIGLLALVSNNRKKV